MSEEWSLGVIVPFHQSMLQEELSRGGGINVGVPDAAAGNDGQSEKRDLFTGQNRRAAAVPDRLAVRTADKVQRQRLDPLFVDLGHRAGISLRRLHQLRGNDPLGTRAKRAAAGPKEKPEKKQLGRPT